MRRRKPREEDAIADGHEKTTEEAENGRQTRVEKKMVEMMMIMRDAAEQHPSSATLSARRPAQKGGVRSHRRDLSLSLSLFSPPPTYAVPR